MVGSYSYWIPKDICSKPVSYTHLDVYKRQKWMWGPEQETIFKAINDNFLKTIMLKHPNFNRPFFMNCDASDISLGSVLYQEDDDGNHQVVSFASRTLNHCERNYHVTEELLSVVFSCGKFRTI